MSNRVMGPHDIDCDEIIEGQRKHITLELMQRTFEDHIKKDSEEEFNEFVDTYWSGLEGTGI